MSTNKRTRDCEDEKEEEAASEVPRRPERYFEWLGEPFTVNGTRYQSAVSNGIVVDLFAEAEAEPDTACCVEEKGVGEGEGEGEGESKGEGEGESESEGEGEGEGEEDPTRGCCGHRKCYLPGTRFEHCCFVEARLDHMGECDGSESPGSEWSM